MKRVTPTIVEIDLEALRFNFRELRKKIPKNVKSLCVVKSNAYGHGAIMLSRVLQEEGADLFGTGTVDEATQLREAGIKRPILVLLGYLDHHFEALLRYQLTPVLYDLQTAERLNSFLAGQKKRLPVHLKVDTGMTRLGIWPSEVSFFCRRLKGLTHLEPAGLLTHLADAGDEKYTDKQETAFCEARKVFEEQFPGLLHLANSQAVIDGRIGTRASGNWMVRLGIALYGAYPLERDRRLIDLKPVMHWKSRLITVKKVPAKTPVSYNRTFTTRRESLIGVIPVGYADGYPRLLSNKAEVLIHGKRVPLVGTICMDLMMADLTGLPDAKKVKTGDEVVLLGRQGQEEIRAEEVARKAQTISYEIFCRIAERIPRVYR